MKEEEQKKFLGGTQGQEGGDYEERNTIGKIEKVVRPQSAMNPDAEHTVDRSLDLTIVNNDDNRLPNLVDLKSSSRDNDQSQAISNISFKDMKT